MGSDLERRLIESSQGFPWLIKKLCIHTLDQYRNGKTIEELIEQELNYKELFESDLLNLGKEEKAAINLVAKSAFSGNPCDITDVDNITQEVIDALINKRLIIRTGTTLNIYWDIFRDYVVTGDIPVIGESYLLRQSGKTCLDLFLAFKNFELADVSHIRLSYSNKISEKSLNNILLELRSLGLIKKSIEGGFFSLTEKVTEVTKDFFVKYISDKFLNYTPYLELLKIDKSKISTTDIVKILKTVFKTEKFKEETWRTYANNLVIWLSISDLSICAKLIENRKGRRGGATNSEMLPNYSPQTLIIAYNKLKNGEVINSREARDLHLMKLINEDQKFLLIDDNITSHIINNALKYVRIKAVFDLYKKYPDIKTNDLIKNHASLLLDRKTLHSKKQTASVLLAWARYIESPLSLNHRKKSTLKKRYLTMGPDLILQKLKEIQKTDKKAIKCNAALLNDLRYFDLVEDSDGITLSKNGMDVIHSPTPMIKLGQIAESKTEVNQLIKYLDRRKRVKTQEIVSLEHDFFLEKGAQISKENSCRIYMAWAKAAFAYRIDNNKIGSLF